MALFKIFKGNSVNLPKTYNDGYCYVTIDEGKMYIDTTNAAAGRIVLNAERADKDAYGREIHRFYESMVPQGTAIPSNVNLNTINFLQVGNYYCSQDATVKTLTNCPTDQAFMMRVYSPLSTTVDNESTSTYVYRLRKIITYKGQEYYQAVNSGASASTFTYGPWYSELNSQGKLTLSGDLSGSVDLSNNMTLTADITASGVTAGKYGPTANSTPAHGASFKVPEFTVAADGRITAATTRTITLPADNNTTYGLSAEPGHIIQLKDNNNGVTKVTLVQGNDMVLTTDTTNDKITIAHETFTTKKASKNTTATPAHGGTFDVLDSVTTDNGHVTGYTVKTVTLPVDNNTTYTISAKNNIITLDGSTGTDTTVTLAAGNNINVSTGASDNKITVKHADFTTTPSTSSATDKSPAHGGSFSVIDGITTSNGHVTGYTTKSVKLPADNNTTSSLSAEYNSTGKKHQIRLTESSGTTYNVELAPGNDITLTTDTTNDKITITHEAFTTTGTTSSATDKTPAHGGSFSVIDGITTDNGHVTGYTTKSIKLPADNNTTYTLDLDSNAKVTLNASTGTDTNVTFTAGNDIVVTPNTTDKTINIKHQDFTTTKNSTNATAAPAHGGTVEVLGSITVDNGHVTGYQNKTITLPADNNTTSALSAEANNIIQLKESSGTTYKVTLAAGNDIGLTTDTSTDTITIKHTDFSTTEGTSTTAAPAHGTSFTVLDSITTDNGHVTGFVKKTVTLPADNNTDTKVTQTAKSDNVNYPLLGAYAASPTSGTAAGTVYDTGMHMNPSTNTITATTFAGNLSGNATTATTASSCSGNAATATKLATARTISLTGSVTGSGSFDGSGNLSIATATNHTHSYLPLAGGTMTGDLNIGNSLHLSSDAEGGNIRINPPSSTGVQCWEADAYNGDFRIYGQKNDGTYLTQFSLGADGSINLNGPTNSRGYAITNLGWPSANRDAAPKEYVDSVANGKLSTSGGTMTGRITRSNEAGTLAQGWEGCLLAAENVSPYTGIYCGNGDAPADALGTSGVANLFIKSWYGVGFVDGCTGQGMTVGIDCRSGTIYSNKTYGAVWNDYAEFRSQKEEIKPGYCVASADNGQVYKTTEKFQACDGIVSDTFGFAIGETEECKTPLAVAGRVLAYCEGDRYSYHSGDTVCAGPDGKVVKMTREEIREWPDRIIGIVSEIPEYETWGTGNVAVDGRIWIKVK